MNRKSTNCVFINYTVRGDENALNIFKSIMLKKNSFNFTLKRKKATGVSWCGNSFLKDHNIVFNTYLYSLYNYTYYLKFYANKPHI